MAKKHKTGFTLIELIVVIGIIVLLATLSVPAYNGIMRDHRRKAIDTAVSSALRAAQAHASQTQNYAGVRFQFARPTGSKVDDPTDPGDNDGTEASATDWRTQSQHMVLIEAVTGSTILPQTPEAVAGDYPTVFLPVANRKTLAIPPGFGVAAENMDWDRDGSDDDEDDFDEDFKIMDHMTFTIIFGPNGQVVNSFPVEVQSRDIDDSIFLYALDFDPSNGVHNVDAPLFDDSDYNTYPWLVAEYPQLGLRTFEVELLQAIEEGGGYAEARKDFFRDLPLQVLNIYTGQFLDLEDLK